MASILYIGNSSAGTTSAHRANALRRLGHTVVVIDPYLMCRDSIDSPWMGALHFRSGYRLLQSQIQQWITRLLPKFHDFNIAWIDNGELLGADCVRLLGKAGLLTVLYNHDDPTGTRDGRRFDSLLKALPFYDICAVVRQKNVVEYKARGAKHVVKILMSYDEVMHMPFQHADQIAPSFRSDVVFIGTWMRGEGRDQFLMELVKKGIPVAIWGQRWEKSPLWNQLKAFHRGENLSGRDYVAAIQGAKVCLGMLSKGNRDLHTTRTMEIPFAGGVLCAERTSEHTELYVEGIEAVFWRDAEECARQCRRLLGDDSWRESVRMAGMARVRAARRGHEDMCQLIVEAALQSQVRSPSANFAVSAG